jgi:predicted RNA-binding protein with PUA-like domain
MAESERYWLVKTEPSCFSISDLAASPRKSTCWSGVRNYQARNFLVAMRRGEKVLFYHSSAEPPAIVGIAVVAREAYPDPTAWDRQDDHFDPKASPDNPIWQMVDLRLEETFAKPLGLDSLRSVPALAKMELLRRGSRLSVQPVTEKEYSTIVELAHAAGPAAAEAKTAKAKKKTAPIKPPRRVRA